MKKIIACVLILLIGSYVLMAQESQFILKFNNVKRNSFYFPVIEYEEDTLSNTHKEILPRISYSKKSNNWGKIIDSVYTNEDTLYINLKWTVTFYVDTTNDRICFYSRSSICPSQKFFTFRLNLLSPFSSFDGSCIVLNGFGDVYYFDRIKKHEYKYCKKKEYYYSQFEEVKNYKWKKIVYDTCEVRGSL